MDDKPFGVEVREQLVRREDRPRASFFWPVILIGVGVAILLRNAGLVPEINWWGLWRLWPVLLIMGGIDLLFGRRWPALGALFALAVVGGAILLLMWAPALGWDTGTMPFIQIPNVFEGPTELKSSTFHELLGNTRSADIYLNLGAYRTEVSAITDGDDLIQADIEHYYDIRFEVTGDRDKRILVDETSQGPGGFHLPLAAERYLWDIRLSPEVPLNLSVDMSAGNADLSLSDLAVVELDLEGSAGNLSATLPSSLRDLRYRGSAGDTYLVVPSGTKAICRVDMSAGDLSWTLKEALDLEITVEDASSGDLRFNVPSDTAIRLVVEADSAGSVRAPRELPKVSGALDKDQGIWETDRYDQAQHQVEIIVEEMSAGDVIVSYLD